MSTLRTRTAKNKAVFYRLRNDLLSSLEDDDVEIRVVRSELSKLSMVFEDLIENYSQLEERYKVYAEVDKLAKLDVDLERIEGDFAEIEELANARLRSARTLTSRIREQEQEIEMLTTDIEKTILEYQNKIQNKDNIVQHQEIENTNAVNSGNPLECEADVTPHDAEASEQVAEHKIEESEPVSDQHEHQPTQPTMCTPQMMSTPINGSGKNSVNRPTVHQMRIFPKNLQITLTTEPVQCLLTVEENQSPWSHYPYQLKPSQLKIHRIGTSKVYLKYQLHVTMVTLKHQS